MIDLVKDGPVGIWQDEEDGFITVAFRGITVGFDPEDWADFTQAIAKAAALCESPIYLYIKARAADEQVPFDLPDSFFRDAFSKGIRVFFGVEVHDDGSLCNDSQNSEFFQQFTGKTPQIAVIATEPTQH